MSQWLEITIKKHVMKADSQAVFVPVALRSRKGAWMVLRKLAEAFGEMVLLSFIASCSICLELFVSSLNKHIVLPYFN